MAWRAGGFLVAPVRCPGRPRPWHGAAVAGMMPASLDVLGCCAPFARHEPAPLHGPSGGSPDWPMGETHMKAITGVFVVLLVSLAGCAQQTQPPAAELAKAKAPPNYYPLKVGSK